MKNEEKPQKLKKIENEEKGNLNLDWAILQKKW